MIKGLKHRGRYVYISSRSKSRVPWERPDEGVLAHQALHLCPIFAPSAPSNPGNGNVDRPKIDLTGGAQQAC
jgi:hypothetical protein